MITSCIRCGKPRIIAKTWTEKANGQTITYTQTVCPDPACQKLVEEELEKRSAKVAALQEKSLERRKSIQLGRKKV